MHDIERINPKAFDAQINQLAEEAEAIRLRLMQAHSKRKGLASTMLILCVLAGGGGFAWFLLMEGRIDIAVLFMVIVIGLPLLLVFWANGPLKTYQRIHKQDFMPKFAKLLGGFKFFPTRGISAKIITRAGILPRHETYNAEDCFMGTYKGVKVIFSEARLYSGKRLVDPVFDGVFVLLEVPEGILEGHTILTADLEMVKRYAPKRWKTLQNVPLDENDANAVLFRMYSDVPEAASLLAGEKLLKELAEAGAVFNNAPISAVFFRKKYIFVAIPYAHDMFEASNVEVPVKTKQHALQCKKEIEQILEIIDVFDIYKKSDSYKKPDSL